MSIEFTLNGQSQTYDGPPMARALDVLRADHTLTGTKEGCGEGECGACTIELDGKIVCSCLVPMTQLHGREVVTIEGIADGDALDIVQRAFIDNGGVQCGACTPGMIMNVRALLQRNDNPDRAEIREMLAGTLCRCTGYERIFQSVEFAVKARLESQS